jgi:hypothetical protein
MLADGSPRYREKQVAEALYGLRNDSGRAVRRQVVAVLRAYRQTGRINVL